MLTVKRKLIAPQNPSDCIQKIGDILSTTAEVKEALKAKKPGFYYREKYSDAQKIIFDTVEISYIKGSFESRKQATNTLNLLPQYENSSIIDLEVNLGWEFIALLIASIFNILFIPNIFYFTSNGKHLFGILIPLVGIITGLIMLIFFFTKRRKLIKNTLYFLKIEAGIKPVNQP